MFARVRVLQVRSGFVAVFTWIHVDEMESSVHVSEVYVHTHVHMCGIHMSCL